MPDNNDNDLNNLSIEEIEALYADLIEFPANDLRIAICYSGPTGSPTGKYAQNLYGC